MHDSDGKGKHFDPKVLGNIVHFHIVMHINPEIYCFPLFRLRRPMVQLQENLKTTTAKLNPADPDPRTNTLIRCNRKEKKEKKEKKRLTKKRKDGQRKEKTRILIEECANEIKIAVQAEHAFQTLIALTMCRHVTKLDQLLEHALRKITAVCLLIFDKIWLFVSIFEKIQLFVYIPGKMLAVCMFTFLK